MECAYQDDLLFWWCGKKPLCFNIEIMTSFARIYPAATTISVEWKTNMWLFRIFVQNNDVAETSRLYDAAAKNHASSSHPRFHRRAFLTTAPSMRHHR